ncbi:hypothetical protein BDAP_001347 [Binucleata daphniae]
MLNFAEFIRSDKYTSLQRSKIINLHEKSKTLQALDVQANSQLTTSANPMFFTLFKQKNQNINYKLEKLRLKIVDDDFFYNINFNKFDKNIKESKRLGWIFSLCLLNGSKKLPILRMLQNKGFDVNLSMLRIAYLPSYYFFAHICKNNQYLYNGKKTTTWNGMPLCVFSHKDYTKYEIVSLTSTTQYKLMLELKVIYDCVYNNDTTKWKQNNLQKFLLNYDAKNNETALYNSFEKHERAVYLADFLAMKNDYNGLKELDATNQIANFSFLVQTNLDFIFLLFRKNHCMQQTLKKITPLHFAVMKGDLALLAIYLEAGLCANAKDINGNTALHYAAMYGNINCYDYLTKRIYKNIQRKNFVVANEDLLNNDGKKALQLMAPKNVDEPSESPECHIIAYNKNKNACIEKASKFKVVVTKKNNKRNVPDHIETKIVKLESIRIEHEFLYAPNEGIYYLNRLIEKTKSELPNKEPQPSYIKMMEEYELDYFYEFFN